MFIIGILIGLYCKISIVFLFIILIVISIIIYLFKRKIIFIIFILILFIGYLYINLLNQNYEKKYINLNGEVNIRAIIISEPIDKEYKYVYTIKVREINGNHQFNNIKLIFEMNKQIKLKNIPKFGDEIMLTGEIEKPEKSRNFKGYDYKEYLKSKNIYGTINTNNFAIKDNEKINFIAKFINLVQNNMKGNINKILDSDEAALCIGILVGDREKITDEIEDNFKKSNLTHMLAVSGSHITYIINAISLILSKSGKKFIKLFTIIFLVFFMALTGFTASVMRASIMGILILIGGLLYKKSDVINNLGISSLLLLIINPFNIIDLGFLLSYAGTIGIILLKDIIDNKLYMILKRITKGKINLLKNEALDNDITKIEISTFNLSEEKTEKQYKLIKYIIEAFSITLSANIMIIPIIAYSFSTLSFTFWISNIIASPIMELATIFGFIIYFLSIIIFPLAQFLGIFLNLLLSILLKIAEISSKIPGASIYIKTPYLFECIIYYIIIFILLNKDIIKNNNIITKIKKNKIKFISLVILIIIIHYYSYIFIPNNLKIYFIDVGQGDCTLITTPTNKHILIDGGGSEFGNFDVGEKILLPYLLDRRITTVDYILISHFDSDHIDGLFAIMENLKIKNIIISKQGQNSNNLIKFKEIVNKNKINVIVVKKGDLIKVDKYSYFEILFPEENFISKNILNNNSIVARFTCLNLNMLFTGDIEEIAEKRLYELYVETNKLKATILKVAHHGSKTSSTENILELIKPKIAFIGVGKDNKFGHPDNNVLQRLQKYTKFIYRTDRMGEIEITLKKGKIYIDNSI